MVSGCALAHALVTITFGRCLSACVGPGKEIYTVGAAGAKGNDGSEEKLYCQVNIEAYCALTW